MTMTTCLRYYNEISNDEACPCGCFVPVTFCQEFDDDGSCIHSDHMSERGL